jgi:(2R)-ethylmalonyl-CoA mutase
MPVVVGGIIPPDDENALRNMGVAAVYTPKDFALDAIVTDVAELAAKGRE